MRLKGQRIRWVLFLWGIFSGFVVGKELPIPGEVFEVEGSEAFVIWPAEKKIDQPWVWYAPTLKKLPAAEEKWMIEKFLAAGVAVAGVDVGESYGSPAGRQVFSAFYDYLIRVKRFGKKPCLLARSRGGLMLYHWAVENPKKVGGVAGIYPVCRLESWPGLEKAAPAYGLTADELKRDLGKHDAISRIGALAKEKVPIFHLHGDVDRVVPYEENSKRLMEAYKKLGGPMEVEVPKGQGHNMWKGFFQSEKLVQFAIDRAFGKPLDPNQPHLPGLKLNSKERAVDVEAEICLADGALELLACTRDTKEHESLLMIKASAMNIHAALLLMGAKPGNPAGAKKVEGVGWIDYPARGGGVKVSLLVPDGKGGEVEKSITEFVVSNNEKAEKLPGDVFLFAGSLLVPDRRDEKKQKVYLADIEGNFMTLSTFGDETLAFPKKFGHMNERLAWKVNRKTVPKVYSEVTLRLRPVVGKGEE